VRIEKCDLVIDISHESDLAAKLFLGKFMQDQKKIVEEAMGCLRPGLVIDCGPKSAYLLVMWADSKTEIIDARDVVPIRGLDKHIEKSLESAL